MAKDPKEYGFEGEMAMSQLKGVMQHAKTLHDMLKPDTDLPEWVQSKITLAYDYMQTAADYMSTEMNEEAGPSYKEELPHILKDIRGKKKSYGDIRREYGLNWKRLSNSTTAEHGNNYNRSHLLAVGKKHMEEEAPANAISAGKIAGTGVGAQGEPGVKADPMARYKKKNAQEAPTAGRKSFSLFMQGK